MELRDRWTSKFQIKPNSWVFVPSEDCITEGRAIKADIGSVWRKPNYYYHLQNGGHVEALKSHLCNISFVHLDIKNFFGCINRSRISRTLKRYFGYDKARSIAISSTVLVPDIHEKRYMLPFGFVQSPILASICLDHSVLGNYLKEVSERQDVVVSVYMDDIVISTKDHDLSEKILDAIKERANKSKFYMNPDKEEGPADSITAFNIELSKGKLEISDERLNDFLSVFGKSDNPHQISGILGYINSVNVDQAKLFKQS